MRRPVNSTWLALCLFIALSVPAAACLNEGEDDNRGEPGGYSAGQVQARTLATTLNPPEFNPNLYTRQIEEYERFYTGPSARKPDHTERTRYGIALVHAGRYEEARDLFAKMEEGSPGIYGTASNLGTCYELTGDNANALRWIKEGVKRNPQSHWGSEWLHVKILEAKLAIEKDKDWLQTNSVLGVDFGDGPQPVLKSALPKGNSGEELTLQQVADGITFQLSERLRFIRSAEPVCADLLTDLGNALLLTDSADAAVVAYERAVYYGATDPQLPARLLLAKQHKDVQPTRELRAGGGSSGALIGGGVAVLMGGLAFVYLRRKRLNANNM